MKGDRSSVVGNDVMSPITIVGGAMSDVDTYSSLDACVKNDPDIKFEPKEYNETNADSTLFPWSETSRTFGEMPIDVLDVKNDSGRDSPSNCHSDALSVDSVHFPLLQPECMNELGVLDNSAEVFYEWTQTPDPSQSSLCAVIIEHNREILQQRLSEMLQNRKRTRQSEKDLPNQQRESTGQKSLKSVFSIKKEVADGFGEMKDGDEVLIERKVAEDFGETQDGDEVLIKKEVADDFDETEKDNCLTEGDLVMVDDPSSLMPEVRIYICQMCGNAYLNSIDLYKHLACCLEGEEEEKEVEALAQSDLLSVITQASDLLTSNTSGTPSSRDAPIPATPSSSSLSNAMSPISCSPSHSSSSTITYSTTDSNVKRKPTLKERLKLGNALEKFGHTDSRLICPCCSLEGDFPVIKRHIVHEVCCGEVECKDCLHMFRLHSAEARSRVKAKDLRVHVLKDGDGRCVKQCPYCTFAEPVSLIEFDDHLLTHPVCVICFRVLQTELGLRRHLSGTHKIDILDLMSESPKYLPPPPSLPTSLSGRLLLLKSANILDSDGALVVDSAPLKCEKCFSAFDSIDSLRRHSSSVDICKECHAKIEKTSSSSSSFQSKRPSILKRKPVQTLCRNCSGKDSKKLKDGSWTH